MLTLYFCVVFHFDLVPQDKSQTDKLNSLSRNEFLSFCKECRLPPRVLQNIGHIFKASLNPDLGAADELFLPQFVESLVRLARELNPPQSAAATALSTLVPATAAASTTSPIITAIGGGVGARDSLPRRLQQLLASMSKNLRSKVSCSYAQSPYPALSQSFPLPLEF